MKNYRNNYERHLNDNDKCAGTCGTCSHADAKNDYANASHVDAKKAQTTYAYYSKVLKEPFDSIEELKEAEKAYYAKLKAKEDAAAEKKSDAAKVEEAFKTLNTARKAYKEGLKGLTERYTADLQKLKSNFEADKLEIHNILAEAEEAYSTLLKAFIDKYPEGYHLTLKDGDFETTISGGATEKTKVASKSSAMSEFSSIFDLLFNF